MSIKGISTVLFRDIRIEQIPNIRNNLYSANSIENLQELAESIKTNGLMQPIVLRGIEGQPPYDVVVGKRRFMAHQSLNLPTIKAVFTGAIDDTEAIILSLSENMLRQEMNHADIMKAVTKLYEEFGRNATRVKERTGLSLRTIRNYIAIETQATPELLGMISTKAISLTNAKRIILTAQGNPDKINALVIPLVKLTKSEQIRAIEYGTKYPNASANQILGEAQKPKLEEAFILTLPRKVYAALEKAAEALHLDKELLVKDVLRDWLKNNDFLVE